QRDEVFNRWMSVKFEHQVNYNTIIWIALIALAIICFVVCWNRVLERQIRERTSELQHQAHNDSLTNLPNRLRCLEYLDELRAQAQEENSRFAVMFIDLDDFKSINDSMGHEAGDALLIDAAIRLKSVLHSDDFVGRLGGDEFVVFVKEKGREGNFSRVADKILLEFKNSFNIENRRLKVSASIGISIYPDNGQTSSVLLSNA
ncbi:GGDEF domain-containing protein, partial [Oleiphilus sp. HI0079]